MVWFVVLAGWATVTAVLAPLGFVFRWSMPRRYR